MAYFIITMSFVTFDTKMSLSQKDGRFKSIFSCITVIYFTTLKTMYAILKYDFFFSGLLCMYAVYTEKFKWTQEFLTSLGCNLNCGTYLDLLYPSQWHTFLSISILQQQFIYANSWISVYNCLENCIKYSRLPPP